MATDLGPVQLPAGSTVAALVSLLCEQRPALAHAATAVNGQFVARASREGWVLADGDAVLCFSPITGG